jgi:hypothetical protein
MASCPIKNRLRIIAIVLLFVVALNALAAGYSFMTDPPGKGSGISTGYLFRPAPFTNYLIPGIVLFPVNGILRIVIAIGASRKQKAYPWLLVAQGCILIGWIGIQLLMVPTIHPLHYMMAFAGFLLMVFGWIIHLKEA